MLSTGAIEKVVYTRSTVFLNRVAGYYPGSLTEKMYEYFAQQIEYFEEFVGREMFRRLQAENIVRILPVEILRGRSFDNALVIMDEAQNCSKEEFILLLTRIGRGSKLILIGDTSQRDTRDNFFQRAFDNLEDENIHKVMLTEDDILRHKSVYSIYKKALDI